MWNMMDRFVFGLIVLILQGLLLSTTAIARDSSLDLTPVEQRWLDDHPTISLAYDGYFPPYSFLNDDGELEGFSIDLMALISQKTGLEFQVHPEHEWKAIYTSAQQQQVDMVTSMVPRDERDQWFEFTKPYIFKSLVVITQDENNSIKQREDIAGKTIALVKDYQYGLQVLNEFPSITPLYVDTMLDALNAVSVGKADATISFLGAGHYYRNKYLLTNLKYTAIYDKRSAFESIAVRKDWPELTRILNKALDSISEAQLQQLRTKWLPVDYMENLVEINLTQAEKQWLKDHRDIRLGIDPEFAPFEYLSEGVYQGIASDYIKLLNQRLNLNMTVTNGLTWAEVISNAKQGHIDVLPAVGMTEERKRFLSYTQPYLSFHRVIITRDDAPFIADLSDIQYQTVAVQSNSSHHGYIRENSDIQPVFYKELQQALLAVSGGQADAFVGNVASATYWIRKLNLTNLKIAAPVSTDVQSLHFAVRKDWPELTTILQKGLDTISPRQRKLISEKWLTVEYEPAVDYDLVWKIVIVFSLVLIAILFWSFYLKRKVRLKSSQLAYTKNYDQLTDLPNRFLTLEELQQSIQEAHLKRHKVALISIDIDDFKKINDIFNHQTGDSILRAFSTRLKTSLQEHHSELSLLGKDAPKQQTIGRLGGNQFLVVQGYLEKPSDAAVLAEEILACTHKTFAIPEHEISLSVSLGISLYPDDGDNAELLLKHADTATYHAKDQLQVEYAFYTDNLDRNMSRKLELEQNILGALKRNEFDVYFQPKVEAKTRKTTSFEALLRWHSEALGTVSPAEFIPIAEKSGLIEEIGLFVLKESLAALAFWQKRYGISFSMAINLSPVQFRSDDLIPTIESFILHYSLDSKTIEFEITEGVLLSEYPNMEDNLKDLEALGVSLAMDDFGTGYSSLSYLRKYKFDTLKIDREFINDLPTEESDRKLVSATIAMAHELGMTVVAEGVETEEQSDILVEYRCDLLQGWLFNKARPYDEVTTLLDAEYTVQDTAKEII